MTRVVFAAILVLAIVGACTASATGPAGHGPATQHGDHMDAASAEHGDHMAAPPAHSTPVPSAAPVATATAAATESASVPPATAATSAPTATPDADGVVEITMTDAMRFEPNEITVRAGDSVRFVISNVGVVQHEAIIGTPQEQRDHAEEMAAGDVHYHSNGVLVEPGETGEFETWFPAGQYLIACHLPGHYEAGMVGLLNVVED